jgi:hypothetical protein
MFCTDIGTGSFPDGLEPPLRSSEKALSIATWSFLRSNLPFFCWEGSAGRVKSLAKSVKKKGVPTTLQDRGEKAVRGVFEPGTVGLNFNFLHAACLRSFLLVGLD